VKKAEIIKRLWQTVVGGTVVVDGVVRDVVEVVIYREEDDQWINVVFLENGKELAVEEDGGELALWKEIDFAPTLSENIKYDHETFVWDREESGIAETMSTKRAGVKKAVTPYYIYNAPSGRRITVELWENNLWYYLAEPKPPKISF